MFIPELHQNIWVFLESQGWSIVFGVIFTVFIYQKYLSSHFKKWRQEKEIASQQTFHQTVAAKEAENLRLARIRQLQKNEEILKLAKLKKEEKERLEREKILQEMSVLNMAVGKFEQKKRNLNKIEQTKKSTEEIFEQLISSKPIVFFTKSFCPFSRKVRQLVASYRLSSDEFEFFDLDEPDFNQMIPGDEIQRIFEEKFGRKSVPKMFLNGEYVGGYEEILNFSKNDNFKKMSINDWEAQALSEEGANLGFTKELIDEIRDKKESNPGMFVSAWQEDNEGVGEKNMEDPVEIWLTAAEEGNLEKLKEIYELKPELLNSQDNDGYTALHRAAYENRQNVIKFLLEKKADTEKRTRDGWTPLLSACNWANYEAVGILLSNGADVNALSNGNLTALHLAVNSQNEDYENVFHTVRYLLQAPGIDASVINGSGDTPLQMAHRTSGKIYYLIKDFLERP